MAQCECMLQVGVLGINHKTGDLQLREAIARASEFLFFVHRIVVLSTCNRTEIYFSTTSLAEAHCDLLRVLRSLIVTPFEHHLYSYFGVDCLTHLCRVTAGLDSAILAETEIQRQVKQAYLHSSKKMRLPSPLHFLFQKALKVAKEIRFRQPVSHISFPKILWQIIRQKEMQESKTLFIGNSQINREVIDFFKKKGMRKIDLCTQTEGFGFLNREVLTQWDQYDLIVAGTKAPHYLLHPKEMDLRPRLIFDLSVPRNVDPEIGRLENVKLYNIEELQNLVDQAKDLRRSHELLRENVQRLCFSYRRKLKFCMTRIAGEGNHIANVFHARNKEKEPLKA